MEALTDSMYHDRPQVRRRRAIENMIGRFPVDKWNGHFLRLSNFRWRSPQRSTIDPPVYQRYLLSHRFPSIAKNAGNSNIGRLAQRRSGIVTISVGDHSKLEGWSTPVESNGSVGVGRIAHG